MPLNVPFSRSALRPKVPPAGSPGADPFSSFEQTPAQAQAQVDKRLPAIAPPTAGQVNALLPSVAPMTTVQAQGLIGSELAPYSAAISKQLASTSSALSGIARSVAGQLGAVDYGAPYVDAEGKQAAVDAALQQSLSGAGSKAAQDLQARLAQIGEPGAVQQAVDAVTGTGAGAGNAALASGSASLSELIANEASNKAYGAKLPGIAQQAGMQNIAAANSQSQAELAGEAASLEQQLPTILQNSRARADQRTTARATLSQNLTGRADARANARSGMYTTVRGQGLTAATADAGLLGNEAAAAAPKTFDAGGVEYSIDPTTGAVTPLTTAAPRSPVSVAPGHSLVDPATGKPLYTAPAGKTSSGTGTYSESLSKQRGVIVDTKGRAILKNGKPQNYVPATRKSSSGASTVVFNRMASLAKQYHGSGLSLGGKSVGAVSFTDAYNRLVSFGVGEGLSGDAARRGALSALTAAGYTTGVNVGVTP